MNNNINILIVEDEALEAKAIESELRKMGYNSIGIAINYQKAIKYIQNEKPDLLLLDVNLKHGYTGIDIAKREEVLDIIPIIYITACIDTETRKEIIATHPKSYLSKPLKYEELEVAISLAVANKQGIIKIGYDFTYDLDHQNLFHNKTFVKLSPKEKLLLEQLIIRKGECVPFQVLESTIWEYGDFSESSLRTLVGNLRKKLNPKMVINIQGFGYKLV